MKRWLWPILGCAIVVWVAIVANVGCGLPSLSVKTEVHPTVTVTTTPP